MLPAKISVIIITYNEEKNIKRCLTSVQWANEIIIVDSYSTDNTKMIAGAFENVKILQSAWKGFVEAKKLALSNTSNNWVLWLDADEEVSVELREEIKKEVSAESEYNAYDCPRKTFFLGEWVKHCGWYPGRIVRVFNKEYCCFNENILHEKIIIPDDSKIGHLKSDLLHYSYTSLYQYFDKMNWYGEYGAEELIRRGKKFQSWKLIANPFCAFIKFYLLNKGFMDGKRGFIIGIGSAFSNFIKYVNFYYLEKQKISRKQKNI
jgi:(heptosyl)LPS beta-1,4-glucosyltransferase